MILVIGSRHDKVAAAAARQWPRAALCSAEDFARPGWLWRLDRPSSLRWIVGGRPVADGEISGIFVRRPTFYAEEFLSTHPDDRAYLASEAHAFLAAMLSLTGARVANPAQEGMFGEEIMRRERWAPAARRLGLAVSPLRLASRPVRRRRLRAPAAVQVVGDEAHGDAPAALKHGAVRLARALGLLWATALFDGRRRLLTLTAAAAPGPEAAEALGAMLGQPLPA